MTIYQTNIMLKAINNMEDIMNIDEKTYNEIAELIHSDESPVGIDAKKTHILILHKLNQIEKRLDELETKLNSN